ncbi:pilus assembly protein TadG-related protein [Granulosicoccus sp. 3-233]|uniref:Tad domain-containing protein n=1 Tax=Granulosicoccus sp. 3-233 TaxID=3417969 RepID=UPI003D337087
MKYQQGQVLPLGLALLVFGMLGAYVLFNTGQVATDKMKLANTADAAAYSGTLWQARALNFQSYTNRAMVANQVSIAQAVTLQSWVAYGAVASENISTVLKPVPVFNVVSEGLQRGLDTVEGVVTPVANAMLTVVDAVNRGLSLSQEAMFVSTFVATPDVVRSVVNETDERFEINTGFSGAGLADNLHQWRSFTDGFDGDDMAAMDERVQMINDSRDGFSQQRNWKFFNFWFYSTPLTRHQIRREGTTELIRVNSMDGIQWEWKAKDTMSLHNRLWHWKGTKRYEVPIGWAEAFANSANAGRTIEPGACTSTMQMIRGNCARFLGMNRYGEYRADLGIRSLRGQQTRIAMSNYTGVQAYRSLSRATIEQDKPTISLKVEVALPTEAVSGSDALGSRGQFAAPLTAPGDRLSSVSVAEVFYQRPDEEMPGRASVALEPANGYNPYWASRLSPVSSADRLFALSLRGNGGSTSTPTSNEGGLPESTTALSDYQENDGPVSGADGASADAAGNGERAAVGGAQNPTSLQTASLSSQANSHVQDFESVAAAQVTGELDRLRQDIEDQLMAALRDRVGDLLAGAVSRRFGGNANSLDELGDDLQQLAIDRVGELATAEAVEPFIEAVNEATAMAEALEEEFRAIRQTIVDGFRESFDTLSAEMAEEVGRLEARLEEHREQLLESDLAQSTRETTEDAIDTLNDEIAELQQTFREELADGLMGIVNESSDLYVMQRDEALYLVDEFLRTEVDEISLPWLEQIEEDDTDD